MAATSSNAQSATGAAAQGLSDVDVDRLLAQHGYNELPEERRSALLDFLSHFWGPIPFMIEAAALLSAVVRHWADFAIITVLLLANAIVGFWEEFQAGNAIAALKANLALKARVKRDGEWRDIPARELVPGDLVRLRLGDIVPADVALVNGDPVEIDQSALTGESLPVHKEVGDTAYSGSIVKQGEIDATITATGKQTYFGKTAQLVESAHPKSHFQAAVLKIGNYLILIAAVLVALILTVTLMRGDELTTTLQFALVLTVAAIPVAMPTVLSVTMAVGARILAREQAIVTRLAAIEELAGMDVLCSDKTGTLTQNKLALGEPFCLESVRPDEVLFAAALASRAENKDAIDAAVLAGAGLGEALTGQKILKFQPFDPVSKRTEALVEGVDGKRFRVSKGAPQAILKLLTDATGVESEVTAAIQSFAARGFRALGVARNDGDSGWRFLGVLPLSDPPREDSRSTIEATRAMGVEVKMLTGDQAAIGKEIARQVGLGNGILDAELLGEQGQAEDPGLAAAVDQADGFAQVFPEHKFRIVEMFQENGHITGMTGDGVNDAPALKKADAGIAVSGATDAARAAADIVLTSPGLSAIVTAIQESRKAFQRMNSYAIYRIAETIRVLLFMTLSILVFDFYPVTAVMIVLLALLNDGAILSIAYDRVQYSDEPERWNMQLVLAIASVLGIAGVVSTFVIFYFAESVYGLDRDTIQSLIYLKLSVAGHMTIFVTRSRGPFWSHRPANVLLAAVVGTQIVATLIAVYGIFMTSIGWGLAGLVWLYAMVWALVNDRIKLLAYRMFAPQKPAAIPGAGPRAKPGVSS